MRATWIVVADDEYAAIYTVWRGMARLRRHRELQAPPGAARDRADGGDGANGNGDGSGLQAPATLDERSRSFASQVALHVEDGYLARQFDELILAAAPGFLVYLRESLSESVRAVIVAEITRNLVNARLETLQEQILRVL
jgi:protein required for attachment to host cells